MQVTNAASATARRNRASRACNGLGPPLSRQLQARPSAGRRDKVIEQLPGVQRDQLAAPSYRRLHKNAMVDGRPLEHRHQWNAREVDRPRDRSSAATQFNDRSWPTPSVASI